MRHFRFRGNDDVVGFSEPLGSGRQRPFARTTQGARPAGDLARAFDRPPWETPNSLACIYRLVSTQVPGCPVDGGTAVPGGGNGIIAIVNAFDYPTAGVDLTVLSRQFGLPRTTATWGDASALRDITRGQAGWDFCLLGN